jgi:hypothetical protein
MIGYAIDAIVGGAGDLRVSARKEKAGFVLLLKLSSISPLSGLLLRRT